MTCAFCNRPHDQLDRFAGLDICSTCATSDPEPLMLEHGIYIDWNAQLQTFSTSASIQGVDHELQLTCSPELLQHKLIKLFVHELEVGDPIFDDQIYLRTNTKARAADLLANEGVQTALLALLSGVRPGQVFPNHVTLEQGQLTARSIPLEGIGEDKVFDLRKHFAALALHLQRWSRANTAEG